MAGDKRRGAGASPRHASVLAAGLAVLLACLGGARAEPFIPSGNDVVLERLPDAGDGAARDLRAEHRALAADPRNLALALKVARGDLDRSRDLGDPRFLGRAQAALEPWPDGPATPSDILLLRAVILQSNHDFPGALALLSRVLARRGNDAQAWLTQAAIHQAQADYRAALFDCGQLATTVLGLVPDICTASAMSLTGHAPLALRAVTLSLNVNAAEAAREPGVTIWGLTLAAETADRLDDSAAEAWFGRAMTLNPHDPYLLGAWSDWLLDHGRAREVVGLLAGYTLVDPLLLRLTLAEQATGDAALSGHVADLAARFGASRLRGDTVHRREEARFELALRCRPDQAVVLARANWEVQREPADARILLEAAQASGRPAEAAPVLDWIRTNHVQAARLEALASGLRAAAKG